jgi:general secretion pathway protein B
MSFILDALRKSEAARRRSETPDLFATLPQAPAPARSRVAWPLWAMAGFGAVSSAIALWLLLHRPDMPTASPTAAAAQTAIDAGAADTPTDAGVAADLDAGTAADATPADTAVPPPAAMPPAPPATTPAPAPPAMATPQPMPTPAIATPTRTAPPPAPPVAAPAPPPPAPPPANGDRATALADLDPEVRRQLPALKLSMQVWNEDPQRRFVILDGQRLREGDTAGDVVVERITRTEVLLSWRGARLRLPAE